MKKQHTTLDNVLLFIRSKLFEFGPVLTFEFFFGTVRIMKKGVDYIGVGVGAVILNKNGKVFLARRGAQARNERHKWEFPGGAVEFGETLEEAVVREVNEEYGVVIAVLQLLDVVNHIILEEKQHWVSPTFLCSHNGGTARIREPHKCEEIRWFAMDEIPENELTIASKKSLESLRKNSADGNNFLFRRLTWA